ncbi:MAG: 1-(5-phosphoribosyl)-5-[(5-phosphoribosylamino) methylideneamino]imidazole-4-carboxamide isomerase [Thermoleophilia bacterium]
MPEGRQRGGEPPAVRLFPAVDIQGGRCVRLRRGDFADSTVFGDDPVEVARHWVGEGARRLHVVDLDGARSGEPANLPLVERMAEVIERPIQFGGGVRTEEVLSRVASSGISRLVIGTSALIDPAFLERALTVFGERLVVAVDAEDGYVKTHGWLERSGMTAATFAAALHERGIREIIYTDISRDGMLEGVDIAGLRRMAQAAPVEIIASGGVTSLDDLHALRELAPEGVTGVIVGRALYEGRFSLREAQEALGEAGSR